MKTSNKGIALIKSFENFEAKAYKCPAGVLTIGYGHTGVDVKVGQVITEQRACELLSIDLSTAERTVNNQNLKINQNQFDALVSFVYNCGAGNFQKSTLLKIIKVNPNSINITKAFLKWNKGGGKILNGLTRRRKEEANLYFTL